MDTRIRNEIIRLENARELYHDAYIVNLEEYDEKVVRLENQIERVTSDTKREVLERQRKLYLVEIDKMDKSMESTTKFIDTKIETLNKQLTEKKSFDYNIDALSSAIERRNVNEIFEMFETVLNALKVLREEST